MQIKKGITIYFPFRAFHNQEFFNYKVMVYFLLPPLFNLIILFTLNYITRGWGKVAWFFLSKLDFNFQVLYTEYFLFNTPFLLPHFDLAAEVPDAHTWWTYLITSIILFLLSFFIPDKYTPLLYFSRAFIFVIWCALAFFLFFPTSFPSNISLFTKTGFLQIISLLFAIPWIYCVTYYMFGYRLLRKVILTTVVLIYFIILAPFQYLLNACLIHMYSLFLMPALYIYAGLLINIFSAVAFFAYGVSIEQIYTKYKRKP